MNRWKSNIVRLVLWVYWTGFGVMAVKGNGEYYQTHGLAEWLIFGEVDPALRALGWSYYVYTGYADPDRYHTFKAAISFYIKALEEGDNKTLMDAKKKEEEYAGWAQVPGVNIVLPD